MRIHTSATRSTLYAAGQRAGVAVLATRHASRTHDHAYEVTLEGSGGRRNSGRYGAGDAHAATWDEWGIFLATLYEVDPYARCGGSVARPVYADAGDFHRITGDRYRTLTPGEQHKRHRWEYVAPREFACKCGATLDQRERVMAGAL